MHLQVHNCIPSLYTWGRGCIACPRPLTLPLQRSGSTANWQRFLLLPEITLPTDMMGQSAQELSLPWEWPLMPDWWQMAYWTRLLSLLSCGSALAPGGSLGMHLPTLSSLCGSSLDNSPWVAAFPSLSHVSTLQPSRTGVSWGYFPYNYYSESLSQRQFLEVSTLW